MIVIRKTHLLRIIFDLSVLIFAEMRRVVSHDSIASKMTRIGLRTIGKQLKNQFEPLTGMFSAKGSGQVLQVRIGSSQVVVGGTKENQVRIRVERVGSATEQAEGASMVGGARWRRCWRYGYGLARSRCGGGRVEEGALEGF